MKKLFQITDTHAPRGQRTVPGIFFSNKGDAKAKRRELNGGEKQSFKSLRYVVSPGPDHDRYR